MFDDVIELPPSQIVSTIETPLFRRLVASMT
jgi:hypothetical protein